MLLAVALMGVVSRTPLAAVGVLQGPIRAGTGLDYGAVGLLTTIPVVMFALSSLPIGRLRLRYGLSAVMAGGLGLLSVGLFLRSWGGAWGLFAGTVLLGLGLSTANVLIPAAVKENFPDRAGAVTGLYTTCMYVASAVAAAAAMPLFRWTGSWQTTLCVWLPVALAALLVWALLARGRQDRRSGSAAPMGLKGLLRSPTAWWVTVLMGSQSVIYYSVMAWLPAILGSRGLSPDLAGQFTSTFQMGGVLGAVVSAALLSRLREQRVYCGLLGGAFFMGVGLLAFGQSGAVLMACAVLVGFCCSSSFSAAYCVITLRAENPEMAVGLSGMSQTFGYVIAALGPVLMGRIFDVTGSWLPPLSLLALSAVAYGVAGVKVGTSGGPA